ncbi:hypothetical protein FHS04_000811 [Mesoflavibacter sabulilitoris]|uniref:DUF2958 domain-containing protein n=1 Tax=Mesoflavibacter zeaxanthinifaciens subsp. sabulilitoris TaxID=1520893 RepID=A0A2T1N6F0_9FLAO|nr:DUF2958 domain-containing protein [Mesoflavibacter zeaxanthinifaciens]MBB3123314.1 hypothetical protein [Mesoflavibacter zeaxanthinifaciens subsp. sabulilitoris]PSG87050.1 hypothetical protein C7H61_13145 [Mesoflavibacter zeaxanthinifaciens subsp. sabulilitoris]
MKLITPEIEARFKEFEEEQTPENPIFVAKFFNPVGSQTWYASTYDPKSNTCYGYVTGMAYDELGYFSIDELEALKLPYGVRIERDEFFDVMSLDLLTSQETKMKVKIKEKREAELQEINSKNNQNQDLER